MHFALGVLSEFACITNSHFRNGGEVGGYDYFAHGTNIGAKGDVRSASGEASLGRRALQSEFAGFW